jgi:hypothetical protein
MNNIALGKTIIDRHTGKTIKKEIIQSVEMTLEEICLPILLISKNEVLSQTGEKMMQHMFKLD